MDSKLLAKSVEVVIWSKLFILVIMLNRPLPDNLQPCMALVLLEVEREGEQVVLAGNFRGGNDPLDTNPYPNLAPGQEREVRFRDLYGERHHISGRMATALEAHHTVPRELIQGRAVAIFWPIQPFTGVWRLGWIH